MEIKDEKVFHDYLNGVIEGEDVKESTKLYSNAKTFYKMWIQIFQMIKLCMKYTPLNMMACVDCDAARCVNGECRDISTKI